ncbi:MAG: anti-sigma regulatory factor [Nitrospirae bacterium GWC2_56_14]|nr:MAG: anti-sigma regulatory factor [Nitrospirae bacterium GWC2_56_14]
MAEPREKLFEMPITSDEDVIMARQKVRAIAQQLGFSMLDQTRVVTAVSELGRNIVVHAGKGDMNVFRAEEGERSGISIIFSDNGPGITDVDQALTDGYSSVGSMGLGLKGASRLVDRFDIDSNPGAGTTITITKWL